MRDFTTEEALPFLSKLKEAGVLPAWLKEVPDAEEVKKLPDIAFADTGNRKLPLHNKEAAYLSAVSADVLDYPPSQFWKDRLKAACKSYGILADVEKAHAVLAPPDDYHGKRANENEKRFAMTVYETEGGEPFHLYPINFYEEIEDSALKMARDVLEEKLPESQFVAGATALCKAAAEHGVPPHRIPTVIRRMGEERLPSPSYIDDQIAARVKQASLGAEAEAIYRQAADGLLKKAYELDEAAYVWEYADRKVGIRYDLNVATPIATFRSGMTKSAYDALAGSVVCIGGVMVPFVKLACVPDRMAVTLLQPDTARFFIQAKSQPDGMKAAGYLNAISESEQVELLKLLVDHD